MLLETNDDNVVFTLPTGGFLLLHLNVIEVMKQYQQMNSSAKEAGGVLIGQQRYHTEKGGVVGPVHIEITSCTKPAWRDKRSRFGFIRKCTSHVKAVFNAWSNSGGCMGYMGEWHTHPEPTPTPSNIDYDNWRSNLSGTVAVLIIIGQETNWYGFFDGQRFHTLG
jgi:integrative and conjugative element protein (TIGR02256 family)